MAPNIDAAVGGLASYVTTVILFCGFYIRTADMPDYLYWYSKISFIRYSFGSMLINQFDANDEAKSLQVPSGSNICSECAFLILNLCRKPNGRYSGCGVLWRRRRRQV